jgi:hypothetical protein
MAAFFGLTVEARAALAGPATAGAAAAGAALTRLLREWMFF